MRPPDPVRDEGPVSTPALRTSALMNATATPQGTPDHRYRAFVAELLRPLLELREAA